VRNFFAPEVVQTSGMDCGPATLKCLLAGFGIAVSYGRLREACQTSVDGTSIDTMETVANLLGLEAEQVMLPVDHVFLAEANALPAVAVVQRPDGMTHFVVVWRRHGNLLQVMDPAIGRRWTTVEQFSAEVFKHAMPVPAESWREFAVSEEFQAALKSRLRQLGASEAEVHALRTRSEEDATWQGLGTLDAAARLVRSLQAAKGLKKGRESVRALRQFCENPSAIPSQYWSVYTAPPGDEGEEQVVTKGAVLVRVRGARQRTAEEPLSPELTAALNEAPLRPGREILRFLGTSGAIGLGSILLALFIAAAGVLVEALLFRGLFDIASELRLPGQRIAALFAVLAFSAIMLILEIPLFLGVRRLGRQLENHFRIAFLQKIPKLGDRYFQSRLTSDMAERSHATHQLNQLPNLVRQLMSAVLKFCATAAGVIWLEPFVWPYVVLLAAAALVPPFAAQSLLAERDLRVRNQAAGLTRFYLDALLGLLAIRAHGAERKIRREHEKMLGEWAGAGLKLQKAVTILEALQSVATFGLVAALLLSRTFASGQTADIGRVLLLAYWALNLPVLGQDLASLARRYPYYRNLTLRLLDPLGAPEEPVGNEAAAVFDQKGKAPRIEFCNVSVVASGHTILEEIGLTLEAGSHTAIVGPSGAGKSSLAGLLLGWLKPSAGTVLVDGSEIEYGQLRQSIAWVDPSVHLWNQSLYSNLVYGSEAEPPEMEQAVESAMLRGVLETLPEGFQTNLGEAGGLVSGGEGQRVRLARSMLRKNSRLVILDEPFRGLDREKRRELLSRARELWRGCTLLCITHDISETEQFDRAVVVENGRITESGTPLDLFSNPGSRYAQLLAAERQTRSGMWSGSNWRHVRVHSGRILEEQSEAGQQVQSQNVEAA
jgi:ABC-type bacteriocin/lantibiotic exporter with double-glycine peptidase domain